MQSRLSTALEGRYTIDREIGAGGIVIQRINSLESATTFFFIRRLLEQSSTRSMGSSRPALCVSGICFWTYRPERRGE